MSNLYKAGYITKLNETHTTDREGVGTLRMSGGKKYRYVLYNDGTANLTPATGNMVGYHSGADATYHTVTDDMTDVATKVLAGQIDGTNAAVPADGEYFWLLIGGISLTMAVTGINTPVVGGGVAYGTTDYAAAKHVTLQKTFGIWLDAGDNAILDCPDFT